MGNWLEMAPKQLHSMTLASAAMPATLGDLHLEPPRLQSVFGNARLYPSLHKQSKTGHFQETFVIREAQRAKNL
jgi:hypothetical protein